MGLEEAKYSGFPGSVVPRADPIPAGSDNLCCDLTGGFHAHPYAFNFSDVQGASVPCGSPRVPPLCGQPCLELTHHRCRLCATPGSPEMFEFDAADLGMGLKPNGDWGFGTGEFTVSGWLAPGATFATGIEDPAKNWANFFSKADPGPGRLQYGAFAALYGDHRIRFGVEDIASHRLEVTCDDSCVPRGSCPQDVGDWGGTDARGVANDPCVESLGLGFTTCSW